MESTKKFFGYKASLGAFLVIFVNLGICTCLGVFLASIAEYIGWEDVYKRQVLKDHTI